MRAVYHTLLFAALRCSLAYTPPLLSLCHTRRIIRFLIRLTLFSFYYTPYHFGAAMLRHAIICLMPLMMRRCSAY